MIRRLIRLWRLKWTRGKTCKNCAFCNINTKQSRNACCYCIDWAGFRGWMSKKEYTRATQKTANKKKPTNKGRA